MLTIISYSTKVITNYIMTFFPWYGENQLPQVVFTPQQNSYVLVFTPQLLGEGLMIVQVIKMTCILLHGIGNCMALAHEGLTRQAIRRVKTGSCQTLQILNAVITLPLILIQSSTTLECHSPRTW